MQIEKKPINFEDERGSIRDIIAGFNVDSASIITFKAGAVRGNHFHKKTLQYTYIISGKLIYANQQGETPVEKRIVEGGDLTTDSPNSKHAFKALEDSVILQLSKGPRQGKDYEEDTFRLEKKILE